MGAKKYLSLAGLCLLLSGCGFRLASTPQLPAVMNATYIEAGQPNGALENLLRRSLNSGKDRVVSQRSKATAVLTILAESTHRDVLSVNSRGQPNEYALIYKVRFSLYDSQGHVLFPAKTIRLQRDYAYTVTNVLGAGRRSSELQTEMYRDAARLIMLRLVSLNRNSASATTQAQQAGNQRRR